MINHEIREMFNSFQDVQLEGTNNIGTVCNHFEGTDFRTVRRPSDRPFGFRGDPQYLVLFSQILMSSSNVKDAMEQTGLSRYKAKKLIHVLNAAAETRGLPPVYASKPKWNGARSIKCNQTGKEYPSVSEAARAMGVNKSTFFYHLYAASGYSTIKGYTFTEVNPGHREKGPLSLLGIKALQ